MNSFINFPKYVDFRSPPINISAADQSTFARHLRKAIPQSHVFVIRNVNIFHEPYGLSPKIQSKRHLWKVGASNWKRSTKKVLKFLVSLFLPKIDVFQGTWVTDNWSIEYFHWFADVLCRVQLLGGNVNYFPLLLPSNFQERKYVVDSLALLEIPHVYISNYKRYKVRNLAIPEYPAPTGNFNTQVLLHLKHSLIEAATIHEPTLRISRSSPPSKIWVSRSNTPHRNILNESELVADLIFHGFEIYYPELHSLEDQILKFQNASVIAGLHGAGLFNMIYMQPGGKVLEIRRPEDAHNLCYFVEANNLGHSYYYLNAAHSGNIEGHNANCVVDTKELSELLKIIDN